MASTRERRTLSSWSPNVKKLIFVSLRNRRCWRGSNVRKVVSVWWSRTYRRSSWNQKSLGPLDGTPMRAWAVLDLHAPRTHVASPMVLRKKLIKHKQGLFRDTNFHEHGVLLQMQTCADHEHQQWRLVGSGDGRETPSSPAPHARAQLGSQKKQPERWPSGVIGETVNGVLLDVH